MKRIYTLSIITLLFVTLLSTGCSEDKGLGTFSANINGEQWTAIAPSGLKTGNRLTITGVSLNKQIIINIAGVTAGTYNMSLIEGNINPFVYTPDINQQGVQQTFTGVSGSIIVDRVEGSRVSGTFNVSAMNASLHYINVDGKFNNVRFF